MEKKVLDYLGNGELQLRKWQTIEIIGGSRSSASRQVSPQLAVNSRIHLRKKKLWNHPQDREATFIWKH